MKNERCGIQLPAPLTLPSPLGGERDAAQQIAFKLPAYSKVFQLIPTYFLAARPSVQRVPAYSNIFQRIPAYSRIKKISLGFLNHEWTRMDTDLEGYEVGLALRCEPKRRRRGIFVASHAHQQFELRQERHRPSLCRPSGAGVRFDFRYYK